jgi:hypothetical protein
MSIETPAPKWLPWLVTGTAAAGIAFVRFFEKPIFFVMPPCPLHAFTGLYCPGCGATRATRALLHGDFIAAFHFNALYITLLPLVGLFVAQSAWLPRPYRGSKNIGPALLVIAILFGILRNIPVAPFTALAPH